MERLESKRDVIAGGAWRPSGRSVELERIITETLYRLFISLCINHSLCATAVRCGKCLSFVNILLSEGNKAALAQLPDAGPGSNIKTCGGFIRDQGPTRK